MRVLVLFASFGGGHRTAAKALKSNILSNDSHSTVEVVDSLEYISPLLNKTISEVYIKIARSAPKVFGLIYKQSNKENKFKNFIFTLNQVFSRKILPLIEDFKPDIIISTHMFPTEMVSYLKSSGKIQMPLVCVITDYAPHKTWIASKVDAYIVASNDMVTEMLQLGIKPDNVYPFGIPVESNFFHIGNKKEILRQIGLELNVPTVLIMAGSFGVRDIFQFYVNLMDSKMDFQTVLITGKNKKLYSDIYNFIKSRKEKSENIKRTKLIYFTNEVHKFMQVADLIITKPGGLTVSEALASGLPMAIIDSIPGQEEENANFLIKNNMGIKISKSRDCILEVENLLENKNQLSGMQNSCKMHSQSMSGRSIYFLIKRLAEH